MRASLALDSHAPLITGADCEGAGEMFQVTTLDLEKPLKKAATGKVDYTEDFFGKPSYLTVSGQLNGAPAAPPLHAPCTYHARTMHAPCMHHACTMHRPCP